MAETLLTLREAAETLRVSPYALSRYARLGKVKYYRVGEGVGRIKFKTEDLATFLESGLMRGIQHKAAPA